MNLVELSMVFGALSLSLFLYWLNLKRHSAQKLSNPPSKTDLLVAHNKRSKKMAMEMIQRQFEIALIPGKEISINNLSAVNTKLVKLHLGLRIANPCEYPVTLERVQWELWVDPVIKFCACEPKIQLKAHSSVEDFVIQDLMQEQDFAELVALGQKKQPSGYVEGQAFCRTDFGPFQKKFFAFDVPYQLMGDLGSIIKSAHSDIPANQDSLTGLLPRKFIEENFQKIVDSAGSSHPISLIMLDVDHFKTFNDSYGHLVGDEILKTVCTKLKEVVEGKGLGVRYGGDEFCIILEGVELDKAETIARKLHQSVGECKLRSPSGELNITLSVGVAVLQHPADYRELIKMADKALYQSKRNGRNQVSVNAE